MPMLDRPGAQIWWESRGTGSPVLLIQGLGHPSDAAWRILPALLTWHTLVLTDNRGVGLSEVPRARFTIEDMAADAAGVLEAAGTGPAHVVGFSMGGLIAQELALHRPDLVRSLTLGCTSPGGPHAVLMSRRVAHLFDHLLAFTPREAAERAAAVSYTRGTPLAAIRADTEVRMARPVSRLGYARQLDATARYAGSLRRLPKLACPTLVLHGDKDQIVPPRNAELLHRAIPGSQLRILHQAGHIFTTDATAATTEALLDFFEQADLGAASALGRAGRAG